MPQPNSPLVQHLALRKSAPAQNEWPVLLEVVLHKDLADRYLADEQA